VAGDQSVIYLQGHLGPEGGVNSGKEKRKICDSELKSKLSRNGRGRQEAGRVCTERLDPRGKVILANRDSAFKKP
jgi:hypothetical protein